MLAPPPALPRPAARTRLGPRASAAASPPARCSAAAVLVAPALRAAPPPRPPADEEVVEECSPSRPAAAGVPPPAVARPPHHRHRHPPPPHYSLAGPRRALRRRPQAGRELASASRWALERAPPPAHCSHAAALAAAPPSSSRPGKKKPAPLPKEADMTDPATQACLWAVVRAEAAAEAKREPFLASFLYSAVLSHDSLPRCLASVLANKLGSASGPLPNTLLYELLRSALPASPQAVACAHADLAAVMERDPACGSYTQCILFFKGYQALQSHRAAHALWQSGRRALATALGSLAAEAFDVDIHPAARLGPGLMLDHATGVRIGESAVVGAGVSMLHRVTLGGAGPAAGGRHPTVGDGVLLGAGVSVLGAVTVGAGAKVGAGSVVLTDLPPNCTAVGVPARVVGFAKPKPRAAQLAAAGGAEGPGGGGGRAGEEGGGGGDGGGAPGLAIPECDMDQCAALNAVMDWTI